MHTKRPLLPMRATKTTITENRATREHPRGRRERPGRQTGQKSGPAPPRARGDPVGQVKASPADGRPRPALKVWIRVRPVCRGNSGFFYRSTGAIQDQPLTGKTSYPVMAKNYHR